MKVQSKPKLYALLVGISNYASEIRLVNQTIRFPKLSGCVDDVKKIKKYLENEDYYEVKMEILINENASKVEIVRLFEEHLSKAEINDTVLFYYSGHGTQEHTDQVLFKSETDGKLESLVCYYNEKTKDNFLLADKELRWLFNKVAAKRPHIVTIFDCCHSSGITRNADLMESVFPKVVEKRINFVFPKRDWNNFIFADQKNSKYITMQELREKGELLLLPEGPHIQLSACESNESAVEVSGEGVFTKALLKTLTSSGGKVSYQMLNNRVRQYLRSVYEQKPMLYLAQSDESVLLKTFLNKQITTSGQLGEVTYNAKIGWQINIGAIHGINPSIKEIHVFDPLKTGRIFIAKPGIINTDSTQLNFDDFELDKEKIYQGNLTGLMSKILLIFIAPQNALPEDQVKLLNELTGNAKEFVDLVDDEKDANYVLRFNNGYYFITNPNDPFRPITEIIKADNYDNWPKIIVQQFKHISSWTFIKNLTNNDRKSQLPDNVISIKIATGIPLGPLIPISIENSKVVINFEIQQNRLVSKIKIEFTNTSDIDIYCCPVYLTSTFQSFAGYLNPSVYHLEPNEIVTLNLKGIEELPIESSEMMKWYNWEKVVDYLKFVVSTEPFESTSLQLVPLPEANLPNSRHFRNIDQTEKGIITELPENDIIKGWRSYDVKIEFVNPNFNRISEKDLQTMLEDDVTNYFALGLYYNGDVNETFVPSYTLKPEIEVENGSGELPKKGMSHDKLLDIANWYARKKRNTFYDNVISRFPDRPRIVSAGDSWFEHPLVLNIIDHLSKIYAFYCVSAAGDTLNNYMSNEKKRGEYFLKALDTQKPKYFLISGGGNDILGSQFRNFLVNSVNKIVKGSGPADFLNKSFLEKVKGLIEIYKSLFGYLEVQQPDLQIIVHGYDYPVKLNDKKHGWLGRYMMEKGILNPADRKDIIHFIMDEFNSRLELICEPFKNVHYLDVRNIVRFNEAENVDQWYDEIHPNNDGFQQIAMRFIQKITKIEKAKRNEISFSHHQ